MAITVDLKSLGAALLWWLRYHGFKWACLIVRFDIQDAFLQMFAICLAKFMSSICRKSISVYDRYLKMRSYSPHPMYKHVYHLWYPTILQDCILDLDWSSALYMAQGLMQLQKLYGPVPVVRGIGAAAEQVADSLSRVIDSAEASIPPGCSHKVSACRVKRALQDICSCKALLA